MPIEFEIKVIRVGNSLRVAIPKEICRALRIEEGDSLLMTVTDSKILARRASARRP